MKANKVSQSAPNSQIANKTFSTRESQIEARLNLLIAASDSTIPLRELQILLCISLGLNYNGLIKDRVGVSDRSVSTSIRRLKERGCVMNVKSTYAHRGIKQVAMTVMGKHVLNEFLGS